jgi:hypothetical protein
LQDDAFPPLSGFGPPDPPPLQQIAVFASHQGHRAFEIECADYGACLRVNDSRLGRQLSVSRPRVARAACCAPRQYFERQIASL